eukprot:UN05838
MTSTLIMTDFAEDHGAGGNDHSNAYVWRYDLRDSEGNRILLKRSDRVSGHLRKIRDPMTGLNWLYINDAGNNRILRINYDNPNQSRGDDVRQIDWTKLSLNITIW